MAGINRNRWPESIGIDGRNRLESMAGIDWNRWPESIGIGGRDQSESVAGIVRNGWPASIGISGRNGPEYAKHHLHRKRFSVAHEFGHVMLNHNLAYYNMPSISWDNPPTEKTHTNAEAALEKEANAFAGELLVPFDMLKLKFAVTRDIAELAKIFLVSQQVMGIAINTHMKALYK